METTADMFYARPILNLPYEYPGRHRELDESNRPTNRIVDTRRPSAYVSPIPKPRKRQAQQLALVTDETAKAVATDDQQYDLTRFINGVRQAVDRWWRLPESGWRVTSETARLLRHWRHHAFADMRPFFCQVEAVETVIWLTEVAPKLGREGRDYLEHLADANSRATAEHAVELNRLALKLATGAGKTTVMALLIAWQAGTEAERTAALRVINAELDRAYTLDDLPDAPRDPWPADVTEVHRLGWEARIARQQEIDASIGARAEVEYLYDKPYEDRKKVRVAGPFTVESLSPHRLVAVNERDELIDRVADRAPAYGTAEDFAAMVLGHLATTGVQQAHKADRITFSSVDPWPGERICAQGRYTEGEEGPERRAGILVGPEFGTVARQELVRGAREAAEAGFDVLVACGFNFEPHATEFNQLGALPVLKARMNADLHMADDLANTGKGNLFVVFGEPDIEILPADGEDPETGRVRVKIHGVDVFHPSTGEVRSDGADGIACWFIDTDYNDESFFVRQAYFLGANDPYKALRTTLKAEIDADAWATLYGDTSQPFERPKSGRIAVKVINHLGDEVLKVFGV